jgi:signal transduction histidine kinase
MESVNSSADPKKNEVKMPELALKDNAFIDAHLADIVLESERIYTELLRSKDQLEAELADARLLQKLSMELVHEEGTAELYQKIMDAAVTIMRSQYASMQVLKPEPGTVGKLHLIASSGFSPEAKGFWEWVYTTTNSSCGATLRAGKRVIIPDFANCPFMQGADTLPIFLAAGIHAAQSTPLYSRNGKLLGMISTHWSYVHSPSERDLSLLDILARQAADLIERNQTMESLRQSEERLRALTTELEKRVENRTKELQRSNEDLQQFAHVASHDLKEPVRKIKTYGYRLQDELMKTSASEKQQLFVEKILGSAERMSLMIEGVLTYSTISASEPKIEQVVLSKVLLDIQNDLEVLIQQKEAVVNCNTLPNIEGVQILIYQLFYNLINNSLKFSNPHRKPIINITTSTLLKADNMYLQIEISDNGIGFEPDFNSTIFDTFARLNSRDQYDGTGLGLSLCRKIVERHGGTISASGQKDIGAIFTITLPFIQSAYSA